MSYSYNRRKKIRKCFYRTGHLIDPNRTICKNCHATVDEIRNFFPTPKPGTRTFGAGFFRASGG